MTMSTKINHLCASAARCGESVAMLRFKQREHVGPVMCLGWGESHNRDVGLGGWEGVLRAKWDSCFNVARLCPLCLGHIINVNSQSRDARN